MSEIEKVLELTEKDEDYVTIERNTLKKLLSIADWADDLVQEISFSGQVKDGHKLHRILSDTIGQMSDGLVKKK